MSSKPNSQPAEIVRVDPDAVDADVVARVAKMLQRGGVVAAPTDTVYGFLASVNRLDALERLVDLKLRPKKKPFLLLASDWISVRSVTSSLPSVGRALGARYWPGPLTLILPADPSLPDAVVSAGPTVAVRIPGSALLRAIVAETGCAIAAPSANHTGEEPASTAAEVAERFGKELDLILDGGPASTAKASTLVNCTGREGEVLRRGPIELTPDELKERA
ncbi:MAG: threonylcarbamoyl-AMP synthase [Gemmatimonadetes bacterium]|nr:threonylcarbamoyl-AMP synthase [Gemmatimonadota bacterium]